MMKILFVGEAASLAHVARPLALAQTLDPLCFDVVFACGQRYGHFVRDAGVCWESLDTISGDDFVSRLAKGEPLYTLAQLRRYVQADLELFSRVKPDLIVGDFRVSLGISAATAEIPYVCLANAYWSPYSTQPFPVPDHPLVRAFGEKFCGLMQPLALPFIMGAHIRDFNRLRVERGLKPVRSLKEMYTLGDWTLYCDLPSLAPTANAPSNHRYLGPILWQPDVPLPRWWDEMGSRDVVYFASGSTSDWRLLNPVIESLAKLPETAVVVASSGRDVHVQRDNVFAADYLPALKVLEQARLIVCNGGSGSINQAVSHGVPILGLPSNADQHFAMGGVVAAGAGLLVRAEKADAKSVFSAAIALIEEPEYRANAARLRREAARLDFSKRFNGFLNTLAPTVDPKTALVSDTLF